MTCYFAGFLLGSLFTPKVIRRVGHTGFRRVCLGSLSGGVVTLDLGDAARLGFGSAPDRCVFRRSVRNFRELAQ